MLIFQKETKREKEKERTTNQKGNKSRYLTFDIIISIIKKKLKFVKRQIYDN